MLAPRQGAKLGCAPALLWNGPRAFVFFAAPALALAAFALVGCTPAIGDQCTLSTDCSVQGTRICDTTQPNGYCTIIPCTGNSCPDHAACVEIGASVPGCPYDDYAAPSRVGTAMCLKSCNSDSDCRQNDGYTCATPAGPGSSAVILDTNQSQKVCLVAGPPASFVDAQVCSSNRIDASPLDATLSAAAEGVDAPVDSPLIDTGSDSTALEAGDDSTVEDAAGDSTVADAGSE